MGIAIEQNFYRQNGGYVPVNSEEEIIRRSRL